jgi:VWFA-related protein
MVNEMKKAALVSLLAVSSAAFAQETPPEAQQPQVFRETVEVRVMDLDVAVTDKQGRPVPDLTRNDFTVRVDGKPVPIDYFALVDQGTIHAPDLATVSPDRVLDAYRKEGEAYVPRHFLIYVDSGDLSPGVRNRALDQMKDFITRLGPTDTARVVLFDRLPRELTEWTSSKETLLSAINTMEKGVGMSRLQNEMQTLRTIDSTRSRQSRLMLANTYAEQEATEIETMIKDMRAQLATLTPLPGKKAFLFVSGSLPTQPGQEMFAYASGSGVASASLGPINLRQVPTQIANLAKVANADEITFYTVDAKGLVAEGGTAASDDPLRFRPGVAFFAQQNAQSGMLELATETGGLALINTNDFVGGLGRVYQDASTYYSVGVNLSSLPSAAQYQNVRVEVNRPGLSVRYRRGYAMKSDDERARDVARAALKTNVAYSSFPVKIQLGPAAKAKKQYDQPITVLMPPTALTFLPEGDTAKANAEIYVGVIDEAGRTSDIGKEEASFTQPRSGSADALAYPITLQMRKGNARIVVNVRDKATGKMGTAKADVHVE